MFVAAATAAFGREGGWWMIGTDAVGWVGPVSRPPSKSKLRPPSPSSMAGNVCRLYVQVCVIVFVIGGLKFRAFILG